MQKHFQYFTMLALVVMLGLFVTSCKKDDEPTSGGADNSDIPADPGGSAPATTLNNVVPAATFAKTSGNESRIRVNMLGILDPTTGSPINFAANSNVFVTEDNVLQGIKVSAASTGSTLLADVVFAVDNSGSMGQEADSVAAKIIDFVNFLAASGLDLRVGAVGYDVSGNISGAINLTTATLLNAYLTRPGNTGTSRTVGFSGADSARLSTAASTFANGLSDENGIAAVWFADSLFSWRNSAQRVYVNFTDEPTQPNNIAYWSTQQLCLRWLPTKGTIHTVYSADTSGSWLDLVRERPWALSTCTGGTIKFIPSNAAGLDLRTLPVTGALASSRLIEFVSSNPSAPHTVVITVKTSTADGKTTFNSITY